MVDVFASLFPLLPTGTSQREAAWKHDPRFVASFLRKHTFGSHLEILGTAAYCVHGQALQGHGECVVLSCGWLPAASLALFMGWWNCIVHIVHRPRDVSNWVAHRPSSATRTGFQTSLNILDLLCVHSSSCDSNRSEHCTAVGLHLANFRLSDSCSAHRLCQGNIHRSRQIRLHLNLLVMLHSPPQ